MLRIYVTISLDYTGLLILDYTSKRMNDLLQRIELPTGKPKAPHSKLILAASQSSDEVKHFFLFIFELLKMQIKL